MRGPDRDIVPGLCSVTMRRLGIEEVAKLAAEAGLRAIEWGGDVHVPPGDREATRRARTATAAAGLRTASYGSYLLADGDGSPDTTARVLDTAVALGAPNVRVWTPFGIDPGSSRSSEVADTLRAVCASAAERDLTVGLEFHGGTLTATAASTGALLDAAAAPNLTTYWQPPYWTAGRRPGDDASDITLLAPRLSHVHVYEWTGADDRRPLDEGRGRWHEVIAALRDAAGPARPAPRVAFLEFVTDDDPRALLRDARTLHDLLGAEA
ncbi:MAG TPA: TIM barrel protein [Acidimicrobiia bacterium]